MMDREDLDLVQVDTVDDPVALKDHLTDVVVVDLRDNPPSSGNLRQMRDSSEGSFGEDCRVPWSVTRDVEADSLQVIQGLVGPRYLSHRAIRCRASAWVTFKPASACVMPRSTFESRYKRSIASSTVASSGSS